MASPDPRRQQTRGDTGGALVARDGASEFDAQTAQIRANIEQARRQISDSLVDIQTSVEGSLDWRGWVDDHPWQAIGIAFGVGFYLGMR